MTSKKIMISTQLCLENFLQSRQQSDRAFIDKLNYVLDLDPLKYHFTASGIVIDNDRVLLIFHRYLNKWLHPGGHIENEEEPHQAAQREVLEETGWHTILIGNEVPIDIDIHLIPENYAKSQPEHWHIDCAYLLQPVDQVQATDPEISKWFNFNDVENARLINLLSNLKR